VSVRLGVTTTSDGGVAKGTKDAPEPVPLVQDIDFRRTVAMVELHYQASARVGIGLSLPRLHMDTENNQTGVESTDQGWMDLGAWLLWFPWEEEGEHPPHEFLSLHNLSFSFGITLPTGDELIGSTPALHFSQLGSGSIDVRVGAACNAPVSGTVRLFAGTDAVFDAEGDTGGFRSGTTYDWRIGATWTPLPWLCAMLSFDAIYKEPSLLDQVELVESGGTWWFVTPGAVVRAWPGVVFDVAVAIPVYRRVHSVQTFTDNVWTFGMTFSW